MIPTVTRTRSFTGDIARCPMIEDALAAWKTWSEQRAIPPAMSGPRNSGTPDPTAPLHFQVIDMAQAAWKTWGAQQGRATPSLPFPKELIQLRVWLGRGDDDIAWHARVEQLVRP